MTTSSINRLSYGIRTKLDEALHKIARTTHCTFIEELLLYACHALESIQESRSKKSPKEIIQNSKGNKNEDFKDKKFTVKVLKTIIAKHDSDDDEDDDDDEGPSAGSNQGKSAKRRRHNFGASGSAQPSIKDDEQSLKKSQKSDASASKQHPALPSTGWKIIEHKRCLIEDTDNAHIPKVSTTTWFKPIPEGERLATPEPKWTIPPNDFPELENNWANTYATTYQVPTENKLQRKTYDIGFISTNVLQLTGKRISFTALVQISPGPVPSLMTPGYISSGLVQILVSPTPYVPHPRMTRDPIATIATISKEKSHRYENSAPVPPRQNVVPTAEKTDSSQQGLEFLFSPLLEEYYNPTHVQEIGESSFSRNIDNTDVHSFQPQSHDYRWTRDHPLEQVRGNPTMPVQTRRQLVADPEMCMFALTVSIVEPKNIKEAMADSAWIEAMAGMNFITVGFLLPIAAPSLFNLSDWTKTAFLMVPVKEEVLLCSAGKGIIEQIIQKSYLLRKALYGLKQAPMSLGMMNYQHPDVQTAFSKVISDYNSLFQYEECMSSKRQLFQQRPFQEDKCLIRRENQCFIVLLSGALFQPHRRRDILSYKVCIIRDTREMCCPKIDYSVSRMVADSIYASFNSESPSKFLKSRNNMIKEGT
ncbi:hypothetical protein Tco_0413209 [Tanacetum coccineum]